MKPLGSISTGLLFLLVGTTMSVYAQSGERSSQGNNEQNNAPPPNLWIQKPGAKRPQQPAPRQNGQRPQQQPPPRASQPEPHGPQGGQRNVWQEHRAQNWHSEHRGWEERGGYNGYRIPESRFRSNFGPRHAFRLHSRPVGMMGGFINFQFGGFGFNIIDPLPEYWSDNWYENDDVYIDNVGDGYYLHNRRHPQDRIAISVNVR